MAKAPQPIIRPNLGLYYDRDPLSVPGRGLQDGFNFRIRQGLLTNYQIGWKRFAPTVTLDGPVKLIANFKLRDGTERLVFGTEKELYRYDSATETVSYLTPTYSTGTVDVDASDPATVTGVGTLFVANAAVGDYIAFGNATENAVSAAWYEITAVNDDTTLTIDGPVAGAPLSGSVYTIRKTLNMTFTDWWSKQVFLNDGTDGNDYLVLTNGVDPIYKWDGSSPSVQDAGLNFRCRVLAQYANMLIYGNLIQAGDVLPTSIINSDVGKPFDTTGGLSEQFVVHSGSDGIIAMLPLGDNLAIYCNETGVLAQFLGDPLIFAFRRVFYGYGPIGPNLIADHGDYHQFLGADTLYTFDGGVGNPVDTHVWRAVLLNRDPTRQVIGFTHFDLENGELLWVVPLQADTGAGQGAAAPVPPSRVYAAHYLETADVPQIPTPYSTRAFPFLSAGYYSQQEGMTWASVPDTWGGADYRWNDQQNFLSFPLNLVGDESGKLYTINTDQRGDGAQLPGFVRFGRRALGDGRMRGLLSRIYPDVIPQLGSVGTVQIRSYVSDFAGGGSVSVSDLPYDMAQATRAYGMGEAWVAPYKRGRYLEVELYHDGSPNEAWGLAGYDIDVKGGGRR